MKPLISYFLIVAWLSEYIEDYNLDFKGTFIMGMLVMIYSIMILLQDKKILDKMKANISALIINLLTSIVVLPLITCITIYQYNVLNYENSRNLMLGNTNPTIGLFMLLGLILMPILIIYLPKKIINLLNI